MKTKGWHGDSQYEHLTDLVKRICGIPFSNWTQRSTATSNRLQASDRTVWFARSPSGIGVLLIRTYCCDWDSRSSITFTVVVDGDEQPLSYHAKTRLESFYDSLCEMKRQQDGPLQAAERAAEAERQRQAGLRAEQKRQDTLRRW